MAWLGRALLALVMGGCAAQDAVEGACDDGSLPGELDDLARTPRANRDAEHLALSLDTSAVIATESDYELVLRDLDAIRSLAPHLAEVAVGCGHPNAIEVWAFGRGEEVLEPTMAGSYEPFACLNERFGYAGGALVDGAHGVAFALDGVYSGAVVDAYRDAVRDAGLGADVTVEATWMLPGEFPGSCTIDQRISVAAVVDDGGAAVERTYTFQIDAETSEAWRIVGDGSPELAQ